MLADNKNRHSHDSYIPSLCSSSVSSLNHISNPYVPPSTPTTPTTPTAACSNSHHTTANTVEDNNTVKHKRWDESPFAIELCDDYIYNNDNKNHQHDHHTSFKQKFRDTFSPKQQHHQHNDTTSLYTSSSTHNTSHHLFSSSAPSTTSLSSFYSSPSYSSSAHDRRNRRLYKVTSSFKKLKNIFSLS